jgi:hypothetical protein
MRMSLTKVEVETKARSVRDAALEQLCGRCELGQLTHDDPTLHLLTTAAALLAAQAVLDGKL